MLNDPMLSGDPFKDFDKRFKDFDKRFEKQVESSKKTAVAVIAVCGITGLTIMVFVDWVIVKLLAHFGVI